MLALHQRTVPGTVGLLPGDAPGRGMMYQSRPAEDPRFAHVESEVVRLRQALQAGAIGREHLAQSLSSMTFESQGRYWTIAAETGQWQAWTGYAWSPATPPGRTAAPPPYPAVTPDPQQAAWVQAAPPPAVASRIAAIALVALGVIWAVFCGAVLLLGRLESVAPAEFDGPVIPDSVAGLLAPSLIALLVFGLVEIVVGILVWRGSEVGRIVGITYGVAFALLWMAGLVVGLPALGASALLVAVTMIAVHAYLVLSLAVAWRGR